jgi:hypothetical protein
LPPTDSRNSSLEPSAGSSEELFGLARVRAKSSRPALRARTCPGSLTARFGVAGGQTSPRLRWMGHNVPLGLSPAASFIRHANGSCRRSRRRWDAERGVMTQRFLRPPRPTSGAGSCAGPVVESTLERTWSALADRPRDQALDAERHPGQEPTCAPRQDRPQRLARLNGRREPQQVDRISTRWQPGLTLLGLGDQHLVPLRSRLRGGVDIRAERALDQAFARGRRLGTHECDQP